MPRPKGTLKVTDIHAMHHDRARLNHETYKYLYEQCSNVIRERAATRYLPQYVDYKVPALLFHRPPYKHHHAVRYVTEKLQRNGFTVELTHPPDTLRVTWPPAAPMAPRQRTRPAPKPKKSVLSAKLDALRKRFG